VGGKQTASRVIAVRNRPGLGTTAGARLAGWQLRKILHACLGSYVFMPVWDHTSGSGSDSEVELADADFRFAPESRHLS
jgi:hypothetical protein